MNNATNPTINITHSLSVGLDLGAEHTHLPQFSMATCLQLVTLPCICSFTQLLQSLTKRVMYFQRLKVQTRNQGEALSFRVFPQLTLLPDCSVNHKLRLWLGDAEEHSGSNSCSNKATKSYRRKLNNCLHGNNCFGDGTQFKFILDVLVHNADKPRLYWRALTYEKTVIFHLNKLQSH